MAKKSIDIKPEPKVASKKQLAAPKQVAIFGAGIAGLTAAQELVDRGFDVEVFEAEPPSAVDAMLGGACAIGGMARTQWTRTERPLNRADGGCVSTEPIYEFGREIIEFDADKKQPNAAGLAKLREVAKLAAALAAWQEAVLGLQRLRYVEVLGFRLESENAPDLDAERAKAVKNHLDLFKNPFDPLRRIESVAERGGIGERAAVTVRLIVDRAPDVLAFAAHEYAANSRRKGKIIQLNGLYARNDVRALVVRGYRAKSEDEIVEVDSKKLPLDIARATTVANLLVKLKPDLRVTIEGGGVPHADDCCVKDEQRRLVAVYVDENWVPGEHGFRFFPAFYRHLFDTLERIPILEDRPEHVESARSVIDNLVATRTQGLSFAARTGEESPPLISVPRRPVRSLQELFDLMVEVLRAGGFSMTDATRINLRLFKYMTSSPQRRSAEYEAMSWRDFVETDRFGDAFAEFLETSPRNLVALSASDADARTFGNISVQLMLDHLMERERTDATLNGPTSVAWFLPWRRYLENQGVVFHHAKLDKIEPVVVKTTVTIDGKTKEEEQYQLWAHMLFDPDEATVPKHDGSGDTTWARGVRTVLLRDYLLLALPIHEAQRVVGRLTKDPLFRKPFADADALASLGSGDPTVETPGGEIAHLSGIQYYFPSDVQCIAGHVVYPGTPWRLSSISQPQFWERQRGWWDGYRGVMSVDISDWATPYENETAWKSKRADIARRVWEQIYDRLPKDLRHEMPDPLAFHLDDNIVLDAQQRPRLNRTPLTVERTGVYPSRPGRLAPAGKPPSRSGYEVYKTPVIGRVAMAGTFMQTHTRLTTMEAANESARHAVNGILDAESFQGPRCRVWDPEQNEHADLRYLIELDRQLHDKGLPHFLDILDLRSLPGPLLRPKPRAA